MVAASGRNVPRTPRYAILKAHMLGIGTLAKKVFGTPNDRKVKSVRPLVAQINALEDRFRAMSDADLIGKTRELQGRAQSGEDLDKLLPEAFANCREGARRALGLRAFDTQLMGGIFLHQGNIAEMKTGEGKTLVATFPAYLNALAGKGVHVVTVNDYLAKRDAEWMGKVYRFLGLSVGLIIHDLTAEQRRAHASPLLGAAHADRQDFRLHFALAAVVEDTRSSIGAQRAHQQKWPQGTTQ